jgi:hypothetical protein
MSAAGNPSLGGRGSGELPLIPLLGTAAAEQALPAWPAGQFDPDASGGQHHETARDAVRQRIAHIDRLALKPLWLRVLIALVLLMPRFCRSRILTACAFKRIQDSLHEHGLSAPEEE